MRHLITGASGFIGSHIAERLIRKGEGVMALVRPSSNTEFLKTLGVSLSYGDISDPDSLKKAMQDIDVVYHSAGLADEWISREEAYRVNVEGTRNLLESARTQNIKRFIYVSSLAVLGMKNHYGTPRDAPYFKSGDNYIDTKIDAERLVMQYHADYGLPAVIVRPGFVFGPRDHKFIVRVLELLSKETFAFVGSGKNKVNIVYVENLIDAIELAAAKSQALGRAYNVTNDSHLSVEDFIFKVAQIWNFKKPNKYVPKFAAVMLCNILGAYAAVTRSSRRPTITKTRIKFLSLNLDFDISHTRQELDYVPQVDIDEGLRRTKEWLNTHPQTLS